MTKYYRVIKDTPLWEEGAILELDPSLSNKGGYSPLEDIWNKTKDQTEYLSLNLIEQNPDFFERVYKSEIEKLAFITAEEFKKVFNKFKK